MYDLIMIIGMICFVAIAVLLTKSWEEKSGWYFGATILSVILMFASFKVADLVEESAAWRNNDPGASQAVCEAQSKEDCVRIWVPESYYKPGQWYTE